MFKIKISDLSVYENQPFPYQIVYETAPDISKGCKNLTYHESNFKTQKAALAVADDLTKFLDESFTFLELIYLRLKQLELTVNQSKEYLKINLLDIEKTRIVVLKEQTKQLFAHEHISNLLQYHSHLKYWCFAITKEYYTTANKLYQLLESFETHFINSYRSAQILSENKTLKLFI